MVEVHDTLRLAATVQLVMRLYMMVMGKHAIHREVENAPGWRPQLLQ